MANSNRTAWAASQRKVFNDVRQFNTKAEAEAFAADQRANGFNARVTPFRTGPRAKTVVKFNVHFHAKAA